jgi:hypothetical protein
MTDVRPLNRSVERLLGDLRTSAYAGADFGFASIDRLALSRARPTVAAS